MRVYLNADYREVHAGDRELLIVRKDPHGRFYVDCNAQQEKKLRELRFTEDSVIYEDEEFDTNPDKPEISGKDLLNLTPKKSNGEFVGPDEYKCCVHKRKHNKGTSAYAACWDKNFPESPAPSK